MAGNIPFGSMGGSKVTPSLLYTEEIEGVMPLDITEIALIEKLVIKKGYIKTKGNRLLLRRTGIVYMETRKKDGSMVPDIVAKVNSRTIWSLYYEHELLTRRTCGYNTRWEVYMPGLLKHACFEELAANYVLGTV